MKTAIKNRNEIANGIDAAADEVKSLALRRELRALAREVMKDRNETSDERVDAELLELSKGLIQYARLQNGAIINSTSARIRELMYRRATEGGGKSMGVFGKIKKAIVGEPKPSLTDKVKNEADANLFKMERQMEVLSQEREKSMTELRAIIAKAAEYDKNSYEYKSARRAAGVIKEKIRLQEKNIDTYYKTLMSSQRYIQLIEYGEARKSLAQWVPDPAELDLVMDDLALAVEEFDAAQSEIDSIIGENARRMGTQLEEEEYEDDDFDSEVAKLINAAPAAPKVETAPRSVVNESAPQSVDPLEM